MEAEERQAVMKKRNVKLGFWLNEPVLVAPGSSLLWLCPPFWLEGTLTSTDISSTQQGALGLCRTVYPANTNIQRSCVYILKHCLNIVKLNKQLTHLLFNSSC